jgi:hypothetical protein
MLPVGLYFWLYGPLKGDLGIVFERRYDTS